MNEGQTLDLLQFRRGLPEHCFNLDSGMLWLLRRWANRQRGLLGEPVYLCGGALDPDNKDPRDWDIRVLLPKEVFETKYGDELVWASEQELGAFGRTSWRWVRDMVRTSRDGMKHTHLNIDFQIFPPHKWEKFEGRPRVQIDTFGLDITNSSAPPVLVSTHPSNQSVPGEPKKTAG